MLADDFESFMGPAEEAFCGLDGTSYGQHQGFFPGNIPIVTGNPGPPSVMVSFIDDFWIAIAFIHFFALYFMIFF